MTISTTTNRASYVENGVTTVFPFAPPFVANTDLIVTNQVGVATPVLLTLNVDYTVTGAGSSSGGTVTRTVPGANLSVLLIVRAVPFTQGTVWPNGTGFDGPTVEAAFDRNVMLIDQVNDRLDVAVLGTLTATAQSIANVPAGGVAAINVQAALNELDTEKANVIEPTFTGGTDTTKKIRLELDGITPATTRIVTAPDRDITLNNLSPITASLGADVALNNTANYFDGPSVAQGTVGIWFVSGTVIVQSGAAANAFTVKLWDGTTVIDSAYSDFLAANQNGPIHLSGFITSPAGNLRISVRDLSATDGKIRFNASSNSKDSTITAIRVG